MDYKPKHRFQEFEKLYLVAYEPCFDFFTLFIWDYLKVSKTLKTVNSGPILLPGQPGKIHPGGMSRMGRPPRGHIWRSSKWRLRRGRIYSNAIKIRIKESPFQAWSNFLWLSKASTSWWSSFLSFKWPGFQFQLLIQKFYCRNWKKMSFPTLDLGIKIWSGLLWSQSRLLTSRYNPFLKTTIFDFTYYIQRKYIAAKEID